MFLNSFISLLFCFFYKDKGNYIFLIDLSLLLVNPNKNMNKLFTLILLSFFVSAFAETQTKVDSLENNLKTTTIEKKAEILNELAKAYFPISFDKAFEFANKALELSEKLNNKNEEAMALFYLGFILSKQEKYEKALKHFQRSLVIYEKSNNIKKIAMTLFNIGLIYNYWGNYEKAIELYQKSLIINQELDDKQEIAKILNNLGLIYDYLGNYEKAIEFYQRSLKIKEGTGNKQGIAATLGNIGLVYSDWSNYEKSLEYHQKSLQLYSELGNNKGIANSLNNIGLIYSNLGNDKKALEYYQNSLKIYKDSDNKKGIANSLNNIGLIYFDLGNYEKALIYYQNSLEIKEELGDNQGIVNSLNNIGNIYKKIGNYKNALEYFIKSYQIAKSNNFTQSIMDNYISFSETYSLIGDAKNALEYFKQYTVIKDSIFNQESQKQITELQTKYETEKKEKEIELLTKDKALKEAEIKKQRIFFLLGFITVIFISLLLYIYFRTKETKKRNSLQQELNKYMQKVLTQQMNPHFIFNTLNSIQYYILQNDKKSSTKYLTMFAKLMRITLDNSQHHTIPIKDELNALNLYLELETLRFEKKFDYVIKVDKNSDLLNYKIPTLLIQPYVENAIWHGLMHKQEKGKVTVELNLKDNNIICCIEDNGIGREKAKEIKNKKTHTHKSLGTKITETRLNLINSLYGSNMNIKYIDLKDEMGIAKGTKVEICVPVMN
ncbi:MAG: tetratricopeptide repeat protein [Bacteroidota bacterium]